MSTLHSGVWTSGMEWTEAGRSSLISITHSLADSVLYADEVSLVGTKILQSAVRRRGPRGRGALREAVFRGGGGEGGRGEAGGAGGAPQVQGGDGRTGRETPKKWIGLGGCACTGLPFSFETLAD